MRHLIIRLTSITLLFFAGFPMNAALANHTDTNCNDYAAVRTAAEPDNDSYLPVLEVGKRWVYKRFYRGDPERPLPIPYFELIVDEPIYKDGKDMFSIIGKNAGESDFFKWGDFYEENNTVYVFDYESNGYVPTIDISLEVGYAMMDSYISIAKKRRMSIEGTDRYVLELVGDYVGGSYYWIEGIGALPNLFIWDFIKTSEGTKLLSCHMGDKCIFDAESFMTDISSSQAVYLPMTRPDRIWECVSDDGDNITVKYMKFDGIDHIYTRDFHRIVTFAKSKTKSSSDLANAEYDYFEDVYEYEGYLRETDGKAYTWLKGEYRDNRFYGSLYTPEASYPSNYESSEKLLYDFTCEPGDCLGAFSNMGDYGTFTGFDIISKSTVTVGDEECIMLEVKPTGAGDNSPTYFIVEGIGPVDFGCLSYNEYLNPQANTVSTNHFNRLLDENGNVLFRNPRGCIDFKLPEHLFSSVKAIDEHAHIEISDRMISFGENGNLNEAAIIDLSGRIVKSARANTRLSLTTSDLTPGVYIATATSNGRSAARRKIIVR